MMVGRRRLGLGLGLGMVIGIEWKGVWTERVRLIRVDLGGGGGGGADELMMMRLMGGHEVLIEGMRSGSSSLRARWGATRGTRPMTRIDGGSGW